MTKNITIEYKPHKKQSLFHNSDARYRAFIGGIRSGKTYAGAWEVFMHLHKYPGSSALIVSPTYQMMWHSTLLTLLKIMPPELIAKRRDGTPWVDRDKYEIHLTNGSLIYFRSSQEPGKIRGMEVSMVWLDEASQYPTRETYDVSIGRMSEKGRPQRLMITTTPKGFDWIYDDFVENPTDEHFIVSVRVRDNATNLEEKYISSIEKQYSGAFYKQEVLGEFVGFEGLVYPDFSRETHTFVEYPEFYRTIAGVDFGIRDPSVILVIGLDYDRRAWIIDEFYQSGCDVDQFLDACKEYRGKYNIEMFHCDPSGAQIIRTMNNRGIPATSQKCDIIPRIMEVSSYLKAAEDNHPRLYVHRNNCPKTLMEFSQYRYADTKSGKPTQETPLDVFNHAMDALGYAIMSLTRFEVQLAGGFVRGDFR